MVLYINKPQTSEMKTLYFINAIDLISCLFMCSSHRFVPAQKHEKQIITIHSSVKKPLLLSRAYLCHPYFHGLDETG